MEKVTAAQRSAVNPDLFTLKIEGGAGGAREEVVSLAGVKTLLESPALKKPLKEFYEGALKIIEAAAEPPAEMTQLAPGAGSPSSYEEAPAKRKGGA